MSKFRSNTRPRTNLPRMFSVVLADDHPIVRKGLRSLLARDRSVRIGGEAGNGRDLISLVKRTNPDVAIVDLSMPEMTGTDAIRILKKQAPRLKILILTVHNDQAYVTQLMMAGADGYLLKDAEGEEVFTALRTVLSGRRFFSASVSEMILEEATKKQGPDSSGHSSLILPLTKRETEILQLIAQGLTSRAIAKRLHLSLGTVFTHRNNLMRKLDIHEKAGLVHYAIRTGLVSVTS